MFEDLNKKYKNTVPEGIETKDYPFVELKEFIGKEINVVGFFFTEGKFGRQVVVVTDDKKLIDLPKRCVEDFEIIRDDDKKLEAVLTGHLKLTDLETKSTKSGNTIIFKFADR